MTIRGKGSLRPELLDCAARLHLCRARCCQGSDVALSEEDVADGLPYRADDPYVLPRDPVTDRCACQRADLSCSVYDKRPVVCQLYDCRFNQDIWIDFANRIATP